MRLRFTKGAISSSIQQDETTSNKDIFQFSKGPHDRTVTETSVDNNSSNSLSSSTITTHSNEKQDDNHKIKMKYKVSSSSLMKKLLRLSNQQSKQRQIQRVSEEEDSEYKKDPTDKTSLSSTAPTSGITEYRPTCLDRRQDDDEYCPEGYRYLQHDKAATSQQQGLNVEETGEQRDPSDVSSLENTGSVVQLQSCNRSSNANPTTCSSSVANLLDNKACNDEDRCVTLTTILPNLEANPILKPKMKESTIPILRMVDAKTRHIIPHVAEVQNKETDAIPSVDEFSNLDVRLTWTVEDQYEVVIVQLEDQNLTPNRSLLVEGTIESVQSLLNDTASQQDTEQFGQSVQDDNILLVPSLTTLQEGSKLVQEPNPMANIKQLNDNKEHDDVGRNVVDQTVDLAKHCGAFDVHETALPNTRNEIAWHRCMVRKGSRFFRNKLRQTPFFKSHQHEANTHSQWCIEQESFIDTILQETPVETRETIEKLSSLPSTTTYRKDDDCRDHDDDSNVPIPANTCLIRTGSTVPTSQHDAYDKTRDGACTMIESRNTESEREMSSDADAADVAAAASTAAVDAVDSGSWLVNSSFGEEGTLVDSYGTRSNGEVDDDDDDDDDEVDDLGVLDAFVDMAMKDDLLYQEKQLGHSFM
ncbi:hypothetical protein IV203_014110 [Nitzschia inconspicua]|uniref:Uncharacterized protein n=1 Tax=Nitzschia inconspicua TaxID=303405 RepID=A0A9K3M7X4_9STRA|nr:hypothetical protein IV203_014298 [Nitzschia inconspicua]KAG7375015.1 hypothetical protein IV203_014110 [Nitzschia inconspicua]